MLGACIACDGAEPIGAVKREPHWDVGGLDGSMWRCALIVEEWLMAACLWHTVGMFGHPRCAVFAFAITVPSQWGQHSIWRVDALVACLHFRGGSRVEWRGVLGGALVEEEDEKEKEDEE